MMRKTLSITALLIAAMLLLSGCSEFNRVLDSIIGAGQEEPAPDIKPFTVLEGSITDYFPEGIDGIEAGTGCYIISTGSEKLDFAIPSEDKLMNGSLISFAANGSKLSFSDGTHPDLIIQLN